jgi:molecular chaperone HscB
VQLDEQHDYAAAVGLVRILMFIEKFAQDLNQRLDQFA